MTITLHQLLGYQRVQKRYGDIRTKPYEYIMWHFLDNMHTDLNRVVSCGGKFSRWFQVYHGARQGSVLSSKLYLIYVNDLINELELCQQLHFNNDQF